MSLNYLYHLMNMIAEGVFERLPDLKFVWADGAADMLTPFIWRMDCFGRPHLEQTPWAPKMPSDYLPGHVYFIQGSIDGPGDVDFAGEWLGFTGKDDMLMFGSSYPHWHWATPASCPARAPPSSATSSAGATPPTSTASTSRPASDRSSRTLEAEQGDHDDCHPQPAARQPPAERIAVRCVDSDVHPVPRRGELSQYIPEPMAQQVLPERTRSASRSTTTPPTTRTPTRCGSTPFPPTASSPAAIRIWRSSS